MTDDTTLVEPSTTTDVPVTRLPTRAARGVKAPEKPAAKLQGSTATVPAPKAAEAAKAPVAARRFPPLSRPIARGQVIGADALFIPSVDIVAMLQPGQKNHTRAVGGAPGKGEKRTVAECTKGGMTLGDLRWWVERGMAEFEPPVKFAK